MISPYLLQGGLIVLVGSVATQSVCVNEGDACTFADYYQQLQDGFWSAGLGALTLSLLSTLSRTPMLHDQFAATPDLSAQSIPIVMHSLTLPTPARLGSVVESALLANSKEGAPVHSSARVRSTSALANAPMVKYLMPLNHTAPVPEARVLIQATISVDVQPIASPCHLDRRTLVQPVQLTPSATLWNRCVNATAVSRVKLSPLLTELLPVARMNRHQTQHHVAVDQFVIA